jgi:2',3'-cyclic-nucleotide 2'-phosphodiesterase (5'-nucleotidase family)
VDAGGWSEFKSDRRVLGSRLLLEGFNAIGMDVSNVNGRDLLVGSKAMTRLEDLFEGTFVSANVEVDGEPRFATHVVVDRVVDGRPVRIGITGVTLKSRAASEGWEDGELSFRDPMQSARRMAEELQDRTDLRILLTNLSVRDLENFVEEFPDAYQFIVSGNGDLRSSTPLGAPPFVLAPGTSGKKLAWINVGWGPTDALEVTTGNTLTLDDKVAEDPKTAELVASYRQRMTTYLQNRRSGIHPTGTAATPVPASEQ